MKKLSVLLSLFVIVTNVNAQEAPPAKPVSKTTPDYKKNEISINTAPVLRFLMAGNAPATRFSATYKRNITDHSALRLSLMVDKIEYDNRFQDPLLNEVVFYKTDSMMIIQNTFTPGYASPHINIGYERLFGKRKLKWFYGADLAIGHAKTATYTESKTFYKDTTQGSNAWVEPQPLQREIASTSSKSIVSVGVSPFFGVKCPISKRFLISAQVGVDFSYRNEAVAKNNGSAIDRYHVSSFDFNVSTGFLNDISLIYRF